MELLAWFAYDCNHHHAEGKDGTAGDHGALTTKSIEHECGQGVANWEHEFHASGDESRSFGGHADILDENGGHVVDHKVDLVITMRC